MSVLPGEGSFPILYGTRHISAGVRSSTAYLARPDRDRAFPALLMLHDAAGLTPSVKDLARRLARHGYAVLAPDLHDGASRASGDRWPPPGGVRRLLGDALAFLASRDTEWTEKGRLGLVGLGRGGSHALSLAVGGEGVNAVVLVYPEIPPDLTPVPVPLLGLYGRDDEDLDLDDLTRARRLARRGQWVVYDGVGHGFLDDAAAGYAPAAAADALQRIIEFLRTHLPAPAAAA